MAVKQRNRTDMYPFKKCCQFLLLAVCQGKNMADRGKRSLKSFELCKEVRLPRTNKTLYRVKDCCHQQWQYQHCIALGLVCIRVGYILVVNLSEIWFNK